MIPRPLLRSFLLLLRTFSSQSHASLFSEPFLAKSRTYYHEEGVTLAATLDPSAYLQRVVQRLQEEAERTESVLGVELKGAVLRVVEDEMIRLHVETIAERGESVCLVHRGSRGHRGLHCLPAPNNPDIPSIAHRYVRDVQTRPASRTCQLVHSARTHRQD